MSTPHTFRFHVARRSGTDLWTVCLPHQCAAWDITDPDCDGYGGADYVPHDLAVVRLRQFIAEAQNALAALEQRREQDKPRDTPTTTDT